MAPIQRGATLHRFMAYLLKIINETKGSMPFLTIGDASGRQVVFNWNEEQYAYCHEPASDQEALDIVQLNWTNLRFPWRFAPVTIGPRPVIAQQGTSAAPQAKIPPFLKPELYGDYPLADLLMLADNDALPIEGNREDRDNVMRQLHAYYQGRAWGVEDVKRSRAKVAEMESELKAIKAPAAADKPVLTPAERMARARAAKTAKHLAGATA